MPHFPFAQREQPDHVGRFKFCVNLRSSAVTLPFFQRLPDLLDSAAPIVYTWESGGIPSVLWVFAACVRLNSVHVWPVFCRYPTGRPRKRGSAPQSEQKFLWLRWLRSAKIVVSGRAAASLRIPTLRKARLSGPAPFPQCNEDNPGVRLIARRR